LPIDDCQLPIDRNGKHRRSSTMTRVTRTNRQSAFGNRHCRGLSLVETLLALTITAALMAATMVATDASFKAYADAAEQASAQAGTRMVTNRLLTLIRTSTAHGPLEASAATNPPVTLSGSTITSHYLELLDPSGNIVKVEYKSASKELWLTTTPSGGGASTSQPLIGGVTAATFYAVRRQDDDGLWVLDRGTMDLTIEPSPDATLSLEAGAGSAIRVIASTMPRKLE
jgi:hypothetical protein